MKLNINYLLITVAVIVAAWLLGNSFMNRNRQDNTVSVTGLGEKEFDSDLIVWSGSFTRKNMSLSIAYEELNKDKAQVMQYLTTNGVKADEIVFSAVELTKDIQTSYVDGQPSESFFRGYILSQRVTIQSKDVAKIESISREVTQLINQGVEFNSMAPQYYYTNLASLKQEMVGAATADARNRATRIAESAHSSLGKLKKANMGVFQITAPNSNEDYSWGGSFNTSSRRKKASITVKLDYMVK